MFSDRGASLNFSPGKARWASFRVLEPHVTATKIPPRHTRRRKGVASPWAFVRSTVQKRAYAGATARAACLHRGQSLIFTLTIPWRHMSTENLMLEPSRDACVTPNPPLSMVMYAAAAAAPRREIRLFDCAMQHALAPQWIPFPLRLSAALPEVRLD